MQSKDFLSKSKKVQPIGINSPIAILNLCSVLNSMINEDEKLKVHFEGDPEGLCTVYNLDLKLHRIGIGRGFYLEKE